MSTIGSRLFCYWVYSVLLCLVAPFARAQTLPLTNYSIQNGLPESTVYDIYLDRAGYLWAGTQSGACSFDGRQFKVYDSQLGLPDNHVTAISGSADGVIWFGHRSGMLSYLKNDTITRLKQNFTNGSNVNALYWQNNTLYVATAGNGLFAVSTVKGRFAVKHFTTKNGLPSDTINEFAIKNKRELWLATGKGVCVFDVQNQKPGKLKQPDLMLQNIMAVYQAPNKTLWCGTNEGAVCFVNGNTATVPKIYNSAGGLADQHVNNIAGDVNGNIWLATNKGVAKISGNTVKCFTKANGLLSDIVYIIKEDREHGLWLAQDDGISCFKDSPFELYNTADKLIYNEVYGIAEDADHNFWIGTAQGISIFTRQNDNFIHSRNITQKNGLLDDFIYDIFRDSKNNIWIACVNKGAVCYVAGKKKFIKFDQSNGLAGKKVVNINEDTKGRIWMATLDGGIAMYDPATGKVKSFTAGNGFVSNNLWVIHRDRKGQLWFGTRDKGLVTLDVKTDKFTIVAGQEKLNNHDFGSISSDSKGHIWIATIGDGVYRYDGKKFDRFGNKEGLRSNNPYFVFCDREDNIWLGTNIGLDKLDPIKRTTVSYLKNDGFMGIETNQNAIHQSAGGDLWIGTVNGLMRYRFTRNHHSTSAPLVYITNKHLFFDNDSLQTVSLKHDQNYITFDYLGVSLSNADKVRYSYKLEGLSNEWSPRVTDDKVSYANLPPGKYTFMVKVGYAGGSWSKPAMYTFEISPPFYLTWWFILIAIVLVYLAGSWLYRYRVGQLLKLEKMRNKIASDLHDDIGSALSSISIFSEVADQQLKHEAPPERTREIIGHISFHSRAMLDAMDDIVWAVNPKNDHFDDLSVRMREFAIPLLEARDISFDIDVDEPLRQTRLSMETRKNIYLIFKECINNILKHSGCTRITVSVKKQRDHMEFVVTDNGKGFDVDAASNRNGLKNLQKRAAEINGSVNIQSLPGKGTTVTLIVNII